MSLSSILHVPNLALNLLSVSHITNSLNCSVTFFPSFCLFQDLVMKKIIGRGHEEGRLYRLDMDLSTVPPMQQLKSATLVSVRGNRSHLLQWHHRLGHPSLFTLKKLFP